jgi:hypothetical protein
MPRRPERFWLLALGTLALGACGTSGSSPKDAASGDGTVLPMCTSTTADAPTMSPATFCEIFISICGTTHAGYASVSECVASYEALTTTKPMRQQCQSYHLCQAEALTGDDRANHCGHATGFLGNQACEQTN